MTEERLIFLISLRSSDQLDAEGIRELQAWADVNADNRALLDRMSNERELEHELGRYRSFDPAVGYHRWLLSNRTLKRRRTVRVLGWSAAASILVAVAIGGLIVYRQSRQPGISVVARNNEPVLPGKSTATLTLSNGRQVLLDSAGNGALTKQGNTQVMKEGDGSLAYNGASGEGMIYNTLRTPRAGQYHLTLSDGSQVWLNNVSQLHYPVSFSGNDRVVELEGEGYFEIAKDVAHPFIVKLKDESVEVLGTGFNVKAYSDEPMIQTTLLQGSVRVRRGGTAVVLSPGEQAQANEAIGLKVVRGMPAEEIVSWKNGFFYFGHASLEEVLKQLGRWYDVDVKYAGAVPALGFDGKIDRNLPLKSVLQYLDKNQVHFRLEGRTIVVLPN
jgi:ferric-dicitrate binding protein FerR (iron transport regulator)